MSNPPTRKGPFEGQPKGPFQGQEAPRDPRRRRPRTTAAGPGRQDLAGEDFRAPPPPRDVTTDVSAGRVAYASTSRSAAPATRQAPSAYVEPASGLRRPPSPHVSRALVAAPSRSASSRSAQRARQVETHVSRDLVVAPYDPRAAAPARAQPAARAPPAPAAEHAARAAAARSMPTLEPLDTECPSFNTDDLDEFKRQFFEFGSKRAEKMAAKENERSALEIQTLQAARRPRYSPETAPDAESKRQRVGPSEITTDSEDDDMASYSDLQPSRPDSPISTSYADQVRKTPSPQPNVSPPAGRTQPPTATQTRKQKYPPLIVENLPNWATHFKALKGLLGRAPNARPFGKGVKFSPSDDHEYRHIQRYLTSLEKSEKVSWFSYSLPADRSLKVAIRGLPADTDPESIMEDLRGQGYDPEFVRPIRARKGRPGCIFLGIFRRTAGTIPGIYGVDEILCMPGVKIEAWRGKKGPSQCFRCQGFRHSSQNCHRQQACVRCGHPHSAYQCPRPLAEPATCANCSGPHPANHVLCPVFRREARNRRAGTVATTRRTPAVAKKPSAAAPQGSNIRTPANEPRARGSAARRRRPRGRRGARPERKPQDQPHHQQDQKKAPSAKSSDEKKRDKNAVLVAIEVLNEVLLAVRDGRDPTPIVLRGLAGIISSAD